MSRLVHVAVGVIQNAAGRVLIAQRPAYSHQGGLWEFPGGKVEAGEDVITALSRELREELGVDVKQSRPLINIEHDYGDKQVWLDVHRITEFQGEVHGKEGQPIKWVLPTDLENYKFPRANRGIITAIRLPDRYLITGEFHTIDECVEKIQHAVDTGVRLIQFRVKQMSEKEYLKASNKILEFQAQGVKFLLNASLETFANTSADGLHLNSQRLMLYSHRPLAHNKLLSASVHNEQEMAQASKIMADFVVVSPVLPTKSHTDAINLGWERFAKLTAMANCPVYALGGMRSEDISKAQKYGAQGIAGISCFW